MSESEVTQNNSEEESQKQPKRISGEEEAYKGDNRRDVREDAKFFPHPGGGQRGSGDDGDLTDAMEFLNRIKAEYKNSIPVYDNFLETMRDFKFGKIDENEVCKAVRILFKDKPFLIRNFDEYLPQYLRYGDSRGYEQPGKYPGYHNPRNSVYMGPPPPPIRMAHQVSVMGPLPPPMPQGRPHYMGRKPGQRMGSEPETPKHRLAEDFIHLVKKRYINNPGIYKQFVELLQRSRNSFGRLLTEVSALFSESPDLIELFERNFKPGGSECSDGASDPLMAIKETLAEKKVLEDFLKILNFYNQSSISASDLIFLVEPLIGDGEKLRAFRSFIKYESKEKENGDVRDYERIGSYRIFPTPQYSTDSNIQHDVLNNLCISVSTYESEEDTYVFRNKNSSEELLVRVCDERVESDLILSRLRYLISELEDIYTRISSSNLNNGWLELEDICMSTPLVKETLKQIYDSKGVEVLELLLTNPAKAVPVVLRRLYTVYRENLASHRNHRRSWRALVEEHYYKAYDTKGVSFKNSERKSLTLRHIYGSSKTPFSLSIADEDTITLVRRLFTLFVSSAPPAVANRVSNEDQIALFDSVLSLLTSDVDSRHVVSFEDYALALYISTLYDRFYNLKSLPSEPLTSSSVAVKLGLQEEFRIVNRYAALIAASESLASRDIDPELFEERVRFLTEAAGYKLYNLRRILSKMERLVLQKITQTSEDNFGYDGQFVISKLNGILTLCSLGDNE